jgi:hypothetical protein
MPRCAIASPSRSRTKPTARRARRRRCRSRQQEAARRRGDAPGLRRRAHLRRRLERRAHQVQGQRQQRRRHGAQRLLGHDRRDGRRDQVVRQERQDRLRELRRRGDQYVDRYPDAEPAHQRAGAADAIGRQLAFRAVRRAVSDSITARTEFDAFPPRATLFRRAGLHQYGRHGADASPKVFGLPTARFANGGSVRRRRPEPSCRHARRQRFTSGDRAAAAPASPSTSSTTPAARAPHRPSAPTATATASST